MPDSQPRIVPIISQPFEQNSYVAWFEGRQDCLVIDPGLEPDSIIAVIDDAKLSPAALLITHGHSDHIGGNAALKQRWPQCPIVIGQNEADKLINPRRNLSAQYGLPVLSPAADRLVADGESIEYAGFVLQVREIPGHSSGHVVYIWSAGNPPIVFGGDVLFAGSVGRTDFPDGSLELLREGIHGKLFVLPDDTIVLSGHGPPTTIGEEKRTNPYVGK